MKLEFIMRFPNGMPKGTSQMKGEKVCYNKDGSTYIHHYTKQSVGTAATLFALQLRKYRPEKPMTGPIKLFVVLYFNVKSPKKLWGKYKTTRPDTDNYIKLLKDVMTKQKFWTDDAQVADEHVIKRFAEEASIYISVEEAEEDT